LDFPFFLRRPIVEERVGLRDGETDSYYLVWLYIDVEDVGVDGRII
jgi:hypothetical protein